LTEHTISTSLTAQVSGFGCRASK